MCQCGRHGFSEEAAAKVLAFVDSNRKVEGGLIPVLHLVQEEFGYIPYEAQRIISEELNIPLSDIYGVITFYSRFTLKPTGKYTICVCMGTACYVRGAEKILDTVQNQLGIKPGESTDDGVFSLDTTRCIGACGLAPIMMVNDDVYGKMLPEDVETILAKYRKGAADL